MNAFQSIWAELVGLFVDDGLLAIMLVVVAVLAVFIGAVAPVAAGIVLVFGSVAALFFSVMRKAR